MKALSSLITNFECGNSGRLCCYDIYAVTVNDMYMESSVNEGNTTPPRNFQCFKCGNIGMQEQLYAVIHIQLHVT
jgi:hypothetical protein